MSFLRARRLCSTAKSSNLNHAQFFTQTALRRAPSPVQELYPLLRLPGIISLGGGAPNPSTFPFKSVSFEVPSAASILNNSNDSLKTLSFNDEELDIAFQYGLAKGIPPLYEYLKSFHNNIHKIPYNDWDLCVSTGSQDLITRTFDAILEDGDSIIIEAPTYCGSLAYLKARNINVISVNMDKDGMIADELEYALSKNHNVKILYTIPIGQNPSGSSYSLERKREIYEIACKHNLLLIEDDPYYFLDFDHMDHTKPRAVSFQSMDIESRVIRTDSFSKILSAGMRLGYMTAHSSIIRRIELHLQATCLSTSSVTQMMAYKLLKYWDDAGDGGVVFQKHLSNVCGFYLKQRDVMNKILEMYLNSKCEWNLPSGGMFFWMNIIGIDDSNSLIKEKAKAANVLLLPGNAFYIDERAHKCSFVRASYSLASELEMEEGIKRFASLL